MHSGSINGNHGSLHEDRKSSPHRTTLCNEYALPEMLLQAEMEKARQEAHIIFSTLDVQKRGYIVIGDLISVLRRKGIDPLTNAEVKAILEDVLMRGAEANPDASFETVQDILDVEIEFEYFFQLIGVNAENIVRRALLDRLAIPNWENFVHKVAEIFEQVKPNANGNNAEYNPYLKNMPNHFAISICTVDGQHFSIGDVDQDFSLQSCGNVFAYCIACEEVGVEKVHEYVGFEPTGTTYNAFALDEQNKPYNPLINAGALTVYSLLQPKNSASERFMFLRSRFAEFAGRVKMGFDNSVFLAEKSSADRNIALAYYMKENNVFPENCKLDETVDLYFQMCSITVDTEKLSVMAATLANGGICPINGKKVVSPSTVKCVLQLMYSCGMYDFSGEWACSVGLPAKSGFSGAVTVVIPSVMGICIYSPRLDKHGNSVRAVDFCTRASNLFKWSIFDQILEDECCEENAYNPEGTQPVNADFAAHQEGTITSQKQEPLSASTALLFDNTNQSLSTTPQLEQENPDPNEHNLRKRNIIALLDSMQSCESRWYPRKKRKK